MEHTHTLTPKRVSMVRIQIPEQNKPTAKHSNAASNTLLKPRNANELTNTPIHTNQKSYKNAFDNEFLLVLLDELEWMLLLSQETDTKVVVFELVSRFKLFVIE